LASAYSHEFVECFDEERDPFFWHLSNLSEGFRGGRYHLPHGPGFGIELDWDYVRTHVVEQRATSA